MSENQQIVLIVVKISPHYSIQKNITANKTNLVVKIALKYSKTLIVNYKHDCKSGVKEMCVICDQKYHKSSLKRHMKTVLKVNASRYLVLPDIRQNL